MLEKPETPLEDIRIAFDRFRRLLSELEREWQEIVPENDEERKELDIWGHEHIDSTVRLNSSEK